MAHGAGRAHSAFTTRAATRRNAALCFGILAPLGTPELFGSFADPANHLYVFENIGESGGIRTHDHLIKSQVLYRLSYGLDCGARAAVRTLGRPP